MVYKVSDLEKKKKKHLIFIYLIILGALLSVLIEPIYYTSIIIGSLYHSEHIRRALYARIENVRSVRYQLLIKYYCFSVG